MILVLLGTGLGARFGVGDLRFVLVYSGRGRRIIHSGDDTSSGDCCSGVDGHLAVLDDLLRYYVVDTISMRVMGNPSISYEST